MRKLWLATGIYIVSFTVGWHQSSPKTVSLRSPSQHAPSPQTRQPAQNQPVCLKDRLRNEQLLDQDIARLEGNRRRISGQWRGLELSQMPGSQAAWLLASDSTLPRNTPIGRCTTALCIHQNIYGTARRAKLAYWWYLRMGYVLATTDQPNDQDGLRWSMFSEAELEALWKVSWALSPQFERLPTLKILRRSLRGYRFSEEKYKHACAIADGEARDIVLQDDCLELSASKGFYGGFFFIGVPHELAHHYDFSNQNFSFTPEWLSLSGWVRAPNENRRNVDIQSFGWTSQSQVIGSQLPALDGFVRDYSRKLPSEDWADSVPYTRFYIEEAIKSIPRKAQVVSRKLFDGRVYTPQGLADFYFRKVSADLKAKIQSWTAPCLQAGAPENKNERAEPVDSCLTHQLHKNIDGQIQSLRETDLDYCDLMNQQRSTDLESRLIAAIRSRALTDLQEARSLAESVQARRHQQNFADALTREEPDLIAAAACFDANPFESCYARTRDQLLSHLTKQVLPASSVTPAIQREQRNYISQRPIEQAKQRLERVLNEWAYRIASAIDEEATQAWTTCLLSNRSYQDVPSVFRSTNVNLDVNLQRCLGSTIESSIAELDKNGVSAAPDHILSSHSSAQVSALRRERIRLRFAAQLEREIEGRILEESRRWRRQRRALSGRFMSDLERNWDHSAPTQRHFVEDCVQKARSQVPRFFESLPMSAAEKKIAPDSQASEMAMTGLCTEVANSPRIASLLERNWLRTQPWEAILEKAESLLRQMAANQAIRCRLLQTGREICLKIPWSNYEQSVMARYDAAARGQEELVRRRYELFRHLNNVGVELRRTLLEN